MKQISLIALLCCLIAGSARAATYSGTVTNGSTSLPVSGQKVYIFDSVVYYIDSTTTNSSGAYSFTLPSIVTSGHMLQVYTRACGAFYSNFSIYTGSSLTYNFTVCGSSTTYMLHGTVSLSGGANNGLARLYLISKRYDSSAADTVLTVVDSITTASTGGTYSKTYTSIPGGTLLLKAALLSSHPQYNNYIPTYYVSSLLWSGAYPLASSNFSSSNLTNITMTAGTNPGGQGFIGGSVLLGANKNTAAVGDPLPGRILILTNASNAPVAYTYSDASGHFGFSNLAYGTYKIFGDAWGKTNPALTVTISSTKGSINNIFFQENNKMFWGRLSGLGVAPSSALTAITAYPNPAGDYVEIGGLSAIAGSKTIMILAMNGTVAARQEVAAGAAVRISTAGLAPGLYALRVQTAEGSTTLKLTK